MRIESNCNYAKIMRLLRRKTECFNATERVKSFCKVVFIRPGFQLNYWLSLLFHKLYGTLNMNAKWRIAMDEMLIYLGGPLSCTGYWTISILYHHQSSLLFYTQQLISFDGYFFWHNVILLILTQIKNHCWPKHLCIGHVVVIWLVHCTFSDSEEDSGP